MNSFSFANRYLLTFFCMALSFCLFSWIAYCIPKDLIKQHAIDSEFILRMDSTNDQRHALFKNDNFTDDIMLDMAAYGVASDKNAFTEAMLNNHPENLTDYYSYKSTLPEEEADSFPVSAYGRYWHGYLLPLRGLLIFTDLNGIRIFNLILLSILFLANAYLIFTKISPVICLTYVLTFFAVGFPFISSSMQFNACIYIVFLSVIFVLTTPDYKIKTPYLCILMMITGGLTSYFDLLTVPVITLGFPLSIAILYNGSNNPMKQVLWGTTGWTTGYGGIWALKWILATVVTGIDFLENAGNQIMIRTFNTEDVSILFFKMLPAIYICIALTVCIALCCIAFNKNKTLLSRYAFLLLIGCFPLLWYVILQNHSLQHYWFTWRSLSVTLFCVIVYAVKVMDRFHPQKSNIRVM